MEMRPLSAASENLWACRKGGCGQGLEIKMSTDGGSVLGVDRVRAQETKDAVVRLSVLIVVDFGDGALQQVTPRVTAEVKEMLHTADQQRMRFQAGNILGNG